MSFPSLRVALVAALVVVCGASNEALAQHSRSNPIVEAVKKTRPGIVAIKVNKRSDSGNKESVGTGVIIDERGYIITNGHVVGATTIVQVRLQDGTLLAGTVVKSDPSCDLAIVKVEPKQKLTALPLGPGGDLMEGETVIAIGHPYGYEFTVSTGIISALGREIDMPNDVKLTNLIQTNASINPGNSGGPLININGEVIGITVALRQGAQGIAFALNSDTVKDALRRHLNSVQVAGVVHGLNCKEVIQDEKSSARQRVVIEGVARRTPAAVADLQAGDELVRIAKHAVSNRFDVERALWESKPGQQVMVTLKREGKELTIPLLLTRGNSAEQVATSTAVSSRGTASRVQPTVAGYGR